MNTEIAETFEELIFLTLKRRLTVHLEQNEDPRNSSITVGVYFNGELIDSSTAYLS